MNTVPDKPADEPSLGALLGKEKEPGPMEQTVAALEARIENLQSRNLEERFLWALLAISLADAYVFSHMDNWTGPLVMGVIELIAIAIMADRLGVEAVAPLIDKLTGFLNKAAKTGGE